MKELALSIISSLTFSGLLTAALIFLTKSWISQRLKSAIEHEYAEKLEAYKAELRAEHELALERLKASNAQNQAVQAAATASFTTIHKMAQEKRLQALETFWKATVQLRAKSPAALSLLDILHPDEYNHFLTNPNLRPTLEELTEETLLKDFGSHSAEVDNARLYAGEYLFALFWAYRAITGRILFQLLEGRKKGKIKDWAADSGIYQLLRYVLSGQEIEDFSKLKVTRVNWLHNQIEQKMLSYSAKIISGEASGELGLEQAKRIAEAAAELESKQKAQQ